MSYNVPNFLIDEKIDVGKIKHQMGYNVPDQPNSSSITKYILNVSTIEIKYA